MNSSGARLKLTMRVVAFEWIIIQNVSFIHCIDYRIMNRDVFNIIQTSKVSRVRLNIH